MLFPPHAPVGNYHYGYTSGTVACPFRVEIVPTPLSAPVFHLLSKPESPPSTGKGNGVDRWSLVKYNQPRVGANSVLPGSRKI